jgi:hypothetical protein
MAKLTAFLSGTTLLFSVGTNRGTGAVTDPARDMEDVRRCLDVMRACETRYVIIILHLARALIPSPL